MILGGETEVRGGEIPPFPGFCMKPCIWNYIAMSNDIVFIRKVIHLCCVCFKLNLSNWMTDRFEIRSVAK